MSVALAGVNGTMTLMGSLAGQSCADAAAVAASSKKSASARIQYRRKFKITPEFAAPWPPHLTLRPRAVIPLAQLAIGDRLIKRGPRRAPAGRQYFDQGIAAGAEEHR